MRVDADLCPRLEEEVSISCEAGGNTYIISGPHGSVTNQDLVISSYMTTDDGTYTCSSSSPCGTANDSITIKHVGKNKPSTVAIYNRIQHKMIHNFVLYVLFIGVPPTLPPLPPRYRYSQKRPNFPFNPWTIVHGCQKNYSIRIGSKIHASRD